jgi:hypothetical protein
VSISTNTAQLATLNIVTSNRTYSAKRLLGTASAEAISLSVIADMDASDTATVQVTAGSGTKTIEGGTPFTFFSGRLLP